jgi:hypothetical protein
MRLQLLTKFNKSATHQENGQKISDLCGDTMENPFTLHLHTAVSGDTARNVPIQVFTILRHFPKCLHYSVISLIFPA